MMLTLLNEIFRQSKNFGSNKNRLINADPNMSYAATIFIKAYIYGLTFVVRVAHGSAIPVVLVSRRYSSAYISSGSRLPNY